MWRLLSHSATRSAAALVGRTGARASLQALQNVQSLQSMSSASALFAASARASSSLASNKESVYVDTKDMSKSDKRLLDAVQLCWYSATGDTASLRKMVKAGVDINASDYDMRTGLHLAASEGHLETVKFFVENGASVNVTDRFGSTPVLDSIKARHADVTQFLFSQGAVLNEAMAGSDLCAAAASNDISTVSSLLQSGVSVNASDYDARSALHLAAAEGHQAMVELLLENGADAAALDRFGNTAMTDAARHDHSEIINLLSEAKKHGVKTTTPAPVVMPKIEIDQVPQEHMDEVAKLLESEGVYRGDIVREETHYYYAGLKLHRYYFKRFKPLDVAQHVQSYISAKRLAQHTGRADDLRLNMETENGALYISAAEQDVRDEVETRLQDYVMSLSKERTNMVYSVSNFTSKGTAVPYGSKRLGIYVLDVEDHAPCAMEETDLMKIASSHFISEVPEWLHSRYQGIIDAAVSRMSPVVEIHERRGNDGSVPVLIATRPTSHNLSIPDLSKLIFANNLSCERKTVEGFANGVTVVTLYINGEATDKVIADFADQVSLQLTMPVSQHLSPLFLQGDISAREYAYISAVTKYITHFTPSSHTDFRMLLADETNPLKRRRLVNIGRELRASQYSEAAIVKTLVRNFSLFRSLFEHFDGKFNPKHAAAPSPEANAALAERITQEASSRDFGILDELLEFNNVVLKTNFYKTRRAAVSYRLNPEFLADHSHVFPDIPFGIILSVANDFTGFHVRFRDVARGGIRIIKSRDEASFAANSSTLFVENYNLAHTQNYKNKDIPEFGSKGTILLGLNNQAQPELKFRKYISSILDLLIEDDQIVDYYGKPEILFLGPDEYTADLMEWAALYGRKRGYPFWKALTTGKPASIGGIPHDTYGMTTRSVHKFVTELLADEGIDESTVTKVQTGGPDGDLGSNEILISKDITKAIVDGSGVLYDPNGLDRTELERLAHGRFMVEEFDTSKLTDGGFFVHVNDSNVILPSGEKVKAGDKFRNDFHLHPLCSADLFVPCGGRPESINSTNIGNIIDEETGKAKFKYIVEGANLFVTPEARIMLEDAGVVVFRDASTNKGGVTSSSLEVLAALTLNDDEFAQHMSVEDVANPPEFYATYATQIQEKVEENARLEYRAVQREFAAGRGHRTELTDVISGKINNLVEAIDSSDLFEDKRIRNAMLARSLPACLVDLVGGIDAVLERIPEPYAKAIFSSSLASHYVYSIGLDSNEIAFHNFIAQL